MIFTTIRPRQGYAAYCQPQTSKVDSYNRYQPKVNVLETESTFQIQVAVPGWKKENLAISLEKDVLVVNAKQAEKTDKITAFNRYEFGQQDFTKRFQLPKNVEVENIIATTNDGVLTINLPKRVDTNENTSRAIPVA